MTERLDLSAEVTSELMQLSSIDAFSERIVDVLTNDAKLETVAVLHYEDDGVVVGATHGISSRVLQKSLAAGSRPAGLDIVDLPAGTPILGLIVDSGTSIDTVAFESALVQVLSNACLRSNIIEDEKRFRATGTATSSDERPEWATASAAFQAALASASNEPEPLARADRRVPMTPSANHQVDSLVPGTGPSLYELSVEQRNGYIRTLMDEAGRAESIE